MVQPDSQPNVTNVLAPHQVSEAVKLNRAQLRGRIAQRNKVAKKPSRVKTPVKARKVQKQSRKRNRK